VIQALADLFITRRREGDALLARGVLLAARGAEARLRVFAVLVAGLRVLAVLVARRRVVTVVRAVWRAGSV
jgi:hypothetical protein